MNYSRHKSASRFILAFVFFLLLVSNHISFKTHIFTPVHSYPYRHLYVSNLFFVSFRYILHGAPRQINISAAMRYGILLPLGIQTAADARQIKHMHMEATTNSTTSVSASPNALNAEKADTKMNSLSSSKDNTSCGAVTGAGAGAATAEASGGPGPGTGTGAGADTGTETGATGVNVGTAASEITQSERRKRRQSELHTKQTRQREDAWCLQEEEE
jgi:hypothetical protein